MYQWEFDKEKLLNEIKAVFNHNGKVVIFGCGKLGHDIAGELMHYGLFGGYIDNNPNKLKNNENEHIWKVEDFLGQKRNDYIVLAASQRNMNDMSEQLKKLGKIEGTDYSTYQVFMKEKMPLISYYMFDEVYVELVQICLTERCTLSCEKCAHACNLVPMDAPDMLLSDVEKSADLFFKKVDFVEEFVLIGGEPFLYKDLSKVLEYIGCRYRDKMYRFAITTNGTILPNKNLIELFSKYDVTIRVTDYSETNPNLRNKYKVLLEELKGIKTEVWKTNSRDSWVDYGFGTVDNGDNPERLVRIFDECRTPCREIRGNKYYYCVMARCVSENSGMNVGLDEYFDLSEKANKRDFFAYQMGFLKNGYLSMCKYCRGADAINYQIPAAVQGKKK